MNEEEEVHRIFMKAFSILDEEQIENIRYHLKNETPVFTGPDAIFNYSNLRTGVG